MRTLFATLLAVIGFGLTSPALAATDWTEGRHYFLIEPAIPSTAPKGKVVVTEVFSYACPACNAFQPAMEKLRAGLPASVELNFVPAGFRADEDWPMFQTAYYAAQTLGVDKKMHARMFDAVWKTGELAIADQATQRLKQPAPSIEDAARFYAANAAVKPADFVAAAKSFSVDLKVRQANEYIRAGKVTSTPTIIVNGKYRLDGRSAGGVEPMVELVKWLVAKESH